MGSIFDELLKQAVRAAPMVIANRVLTSFEPMKDQFYVRARHVGAITRLLRRTGHDGITRFPTLKTLDDILWASYRHLHTLHDHEELLVAFGKRSDRSPTAAPKFDRFWRGIGGRSEVGFTPLLRQEIEQHITSVPGGCVVVVHNHAPHGLKWFFSMLFDWTPLPSSTDREMALTHDMGAWRRLFETGHQASFHWYLVDEGKMLRFYLPSVERFQRLFEYVRTRDSVAMPFDVVEAAKLLLL